MPSTRAAPASPERRPLFGGALGILLVATLATRLPFMTSTLYAFDSANYALGVRDFYNVAFHQPHPPGYPVYVFVGRAINLVAHDANRALIIEGILWSLVAVACTTLLGRALFGSRAGLLAGVLLVATVGFWGYAEVAYAYVCLAGETALLAYLSHALLAGRARLAPWLGLAWAVALGTRWDGAIFCTPLALWALALVPWRWRVACVAVAASIVVLWAVPMIVLTGGWSAYLGAFSAYLSVWSPQSAYVGVVGDFAAGGQTQAGYNLNFLINYLRQMLGVGLVLVLYLIGTRFGPARLAADYRSRFLLVWIVPPLLVYVFAHLGEAGYVLSLAPAAAVLVAVAILDLGSEAQAAVDALRGRGWRWLPAARPSGAVVAGVLGVGIVAWNAQAFARGVGPGRLPDLREHDATTGSQIAFIESQPRASTLVLSHDIFRQLKYYVPGYRADLLYSEYVPSFETARQRTDLPQGTDQVIVLDSPLQTSPEDAQRVREVVLRQAPRVSVWVVDSRGARAIEHGYRFVRLLAQ